MSFQITSETSKQYLMEENAVEGFRAAVQNGQSRLALSILIDVIDGLVELLSEHDDVMTQVSESLDDEILNEVVAEAQLAPKTESEQTEEVLSEDESEKPKKNPSQSKKSSSSTE